ncbi:MAG: 5-oxoprolinase subunit PxpB [Solobacterium sp.]|nr:5-oxoprolinase subunit PxpB [Solobacterium sp.]
MIKPCGDTALMIQFEQKIDPAILREVRQMTEKIQKAHLKGIIDLIPSYAALLVKFDPAVFSYEMLKQKIEVLAGKEDRKTAFAVRYIDIPVLYGKPFPEDLDHVAKHAGCSIDEVIRIHTSNEYPVYMMGFLPGFPYLGNLDVRLHTPRRKEPRISIPAGSVGIGGAQTGIYPLTSPGGWHILGLTPVKLYDPDAEDPVLLRSGDVIRFRSVSEEEFREIEEAGGKLCI